MTEQSNLPAVAPQGSLTLGGARSIDAKDLVLPRVKVVQQMSAEASDGRAKPGELFNTLTGENYGTELLFLPILPFQQRIFISRPERLREINDWMESHDADPIAVGDGLRCRSRDMLSGDGDPGFTFDGTPMSGCNRCPLSKWRPGNEPPFCTETYNIGAVNDLGELMILSFSRSSAKTGKRFFSMIRMLPPGQVPYARLYKLATRADRNDRGNFFVQDVVRTPDAPPSELLGYARHWAIQLAGAPIDVTPEEEDMEDSPADSDSPF
jgi:hypothetical protein